VELKFKWCNLVRKQTGNLRLPLAIALFVSGCCFGIWGWLYQPFLSSISADKIAGFSFSPFNRHDDPTKNAFPSDEKIDSDLAIIKKYTNRIRTYTSAQFPNLPSLAQKHRIEITAGIWLTADVTQNAREINAIQTIGASRLVVGNETVLKQALTVSELTTYLDQAKSRTSLPISTAEPWNIWMTNPDLVDHVDFITIHLLPYWEGIDVKNAVGHALYQYDAVSKRFPNKQVVIGEVGWPSNGSPIGAAQANPANQAIFVREFLKEAQSRKLDYFLMEVTDQPWKVTEEGHAGAHWGFLDAYRQPKYALSGEIAQDPQWMRKAGAASVLGFLLAVFCLSKLPTLRTIAKIWFAIAIQVIMAFAVAVVTIPFKTYMRPTDWVALAIFLPTLAVMMMILLAHAFEFAELFWLGSLKRTFSAKPLPPGQKQPFVSIHLACCNEPPGMVIATIASLRQLDYNNFEVVVVDNNTKDDANWLPVQAYMESLPENFRFFHLPSWSGYKAGALNFALAKSAPQAEIVAVVDADYVVHANWLSGLVSYFSDPNVGVVQSPQAHREWGGQIFRRMMNWEYDGFFRIGMHHRNERNAIVQHGTMTLIKASALREFGQWSEWCVCEDTELGLRLMRQGLTTVYVDDALGHGLTPDGFNAFKKQRYRWAQGGMQILKSHWRGLVAKAQPNDQLSDQLSDHLTRSQRYHFVAGWLPWIGDALHLVFALSAIFWTAGVLLLPRWFTLPTTLFLLPLGAFVLAKLVVGPLLYWRRVPCKFSEIVGASIAGMGVSHAIARGVFAGLLSKNARFEVTDKGTSLASPRAKKQSQWSAVKEESFMLIALLCAAVCIVLFLPRGNEVQTTNFGLWLGVLAVQSLPYLAALSCVWLSIRPEKFVKPTPDLCLQKIPDSLR
jgi:exo-beta-1,3-glucanase (GH17 family)/cellulose synthase/poly-beta-1,6-N-acetylglucosamine synthase-like glycosyltransferase